MIGYLGVAGYFARPLWEEPDRVRRIASLLFDARWPWSPAWFSFSGVPGAANTGAARRAEPAVVEGLLRPEHARLLGQRSRQDDKNFARIAISTGRIGADWGYDDPFEVTGFLRTSDLPSGTSVSAWIELVLELLAELQADHAVLCPWPTQSQALADTSLMRIVLDSPSGERKDGVPRSAEREHERIARHRKWLGRTYARAPRWGTCLHPAHLAAIGGVDAVQAAASPAMVRGLGPFTYVQLTAALDDALADETERRRQALEDLLAPVLTPAP